MSRLYFSEKEIVDKCPVESSTVHCKHCGADLTIDGICGMLCKCPHHPAESYDGSYTSFSCRMCGSSVDVEQWRKCNLEQYAEEPVK